MASLNGFVTEFNENIQGNLTKTTGAAMYGHFKTQLFVLYRCGKGHPKLRKMNSGFFGDVKKKMKGIYSRINFERIFFHNCKNAD